MTSIGGIAKWVRTVSIDGQVVRLSRAFGPRLTVLEGAADCELRRAWAGEWLAALDDRFWGGEEVRTGRFRKILFHWHSLSFPGFAGESLSPPYSFMFLLPIELSRRGTGFSDKNVDF